MVDGIRWNGTSLRYYKKGTTEWGVPFNRDTLLGEQIQQFAKESLVVGPNPAADFVSIRFSNGISRNFDVALYTTAGLCVFRENFCYGSSFTVYRKQLPAGIYLLKVVNEDGAEHKVRLCFE
jgi:hypothetical protein